MYHIVKAGNEIGKAERLTWAKAQQNGTTVICTEAEADGIAFDGEVYNLDTLPSSTERETVSAVWKEDVIADEAKLSEHSAILDDLILSSLEV